MRSAAVALHELAISELPPKELIRFLNAVEREVPVGKTVHAILITTATHKHPKMIDFCAGIKRQILSTRSSYSVMCET
jgi:hypothetical protein